MFAADCVNSGVADHVIWYCNQSELLKNSEIWQMEQDCSTKVHYRAKLPGGASYVIIDVSADSSIADSLVKVHGFMVRNGFSAPRILDYNRAQNLILTEDFGDCSYKAVLQQDLSREAELYNLAVEVLGRISFLKVNIDLLLYGPKLLNSTMVKSFNNYYQSKKEASAELVKIFSNLFKHLRFDTLVLRDYHVDNMMLLEDRQGYQKVGLLDIQDASIGHIVYDLVSLLEDARRDVSADVVEKSKYNFLKLCSKINQAEFDYAYSVLGMQRSLRILWLFSYLQGIAGNERYNLFIPRVQNYIKEHLKNNIFEDLQHWSNKYRVPLYD